MPSIVVIGYGFVGHAVKKLFPGAYIHDPLKGHEWNRKTDVAFICVPTPLVDGKLDCSIVEQAVRECDSDLIIIRSTVMPGTCERLYSETYKRIVYQPEYIGEGVSHPLLDESATPFMILGGNDTRAAINLYQSVYNARVRIRQTRWKTAEVIKLSENRAIAFKVAQCQELYDACEAAGVDYYEVREAVYGDDPRFSLDHTFVFPNNRGFGGKCLSKDVPAWAAWAESCGMEPELTKSMLKVNDEILASAKDNNA